MTTAQLPIETEIVAGKDGNIRKLTAAGFVLIDEHGGTEGWRDIESNRCFVDYYGGVWHMRATPKPT